MINTSNNVLVKIHGVELDAAIRDALSHASNAIKRGYELEHIELETVSTKTNQVLGFSRFVELGILKIAASFDELYVHNSFAIAQLPGGVISDELFRLFIPSSDFPALVNNRTYGQHIKRGLGFFLLALHCADAITLPMSFDWPSSRVSEQTTLASTIACEGSELLTFLRTIETVPGKPQDEIFKKLSLKQSRTNWFATYATKVLLASGWSSAEDVNFADLLAINKAQYDDPNGELIGVSVFSSLIDILSLKFGDRVEKGLGSRKAWKDSMALVRVQRAIDNKARKAFAVDGGSTELTPTAVKKISPVVIGVVAGEDVMDSVRHFKRVLKCPPALAHPSRLSDAISKAVGKFDFQSNLGYWSELQAAYIATSKRENYKTVKSSLGCFNLYLFYYLPYWYIEHPHCKVPFPSCPNELNAAVFISRMLKVDEDLPFTFMEFMNERARIIKWDNNAYYNSLMQVEVFFQFLVDNVSRLPKCENFRQPLSPLNYPSSYKPLGTNKITVPRRFLPEFIAYIEAFRFYVEYICDKRFSGDLNDADMIALEESTIVDTGIHADRLGFVPLIFAKNRAIRLSSFPVFPKIDWHRFMNGDEGKVLHPHALNQIAVAVMTGLRHNHIQWLDANKFDSYVDEEVSDYTQLYVNTDKVKKQPWLAIVNFEVIAILRSQLKWRNSINADEFQQDKFYNDNDDTIYTKIRPLFSFSENGLPHPDQAYSSVWKGIIQGFQGILGELVDFDSEKMPVLGRFRPKDVDFLDNDAARKCAKIGKASQTFVGLVFKTPITPHSSRVSVVSEFITYLPAKLIGRYVTGQSEGTVYHYVVPEAEDIKKAQIFQAMDLRKRARAQQIGRIATSGDSDTPHIKADSINSNLARSLNLSVPEAFARYGCISLSIADGPSGKDALERQGVSHAAFNKTEICPFANNCPEYIVKLLRGFRRCALCPVAVRSIDHLPAVCAQQKCAAEELTSFDKELDMAIKSKSRTPMEIESMEIRRQMLGEELTGWELCIEILDQCWRRLAAGDSDRKWVVEEPEILRKQLQRVPASIGDSDYLLARLDESIGYPGFQSAQIKSGFDMLRRIILQRAGGSLSEVLSLDMPVDPASECVGLIRSVVSAHQLSLEDVVGILTTDVHLGTFEHRTSRRLANV